MIILSKIVRKWRPDDYWRIGEHESWFQDMGLEGLHLKSIGYNIAKFEEGEPKKTKYRIDIYQGEHTNKEQKQFYAESGWDFVTDYDEFNIYSSPEELNAPELHSDPVEQAYTLKTLEDKMNGILFMTVISPILILVLLWYILFKDSTPFLAILDHFTMQTIMILVIGSRGFYQTISSYLAIRSLRKDLLDGKPIDHNAPWENRNRKSKVISRILTIMSILVFIFPIISIIKGETKTLPVTTPDLPFVRLIEIEQNPDIIREVSNLDEEIDFANFYNYDWNILAPIQYETHERGVVTNKIWEDDGTTYNPSIITNTYKLTFNNMSKGVFEGLIKEAKSYSNSSDFSEIENPIFDKLIIHKNARFIEVFAYKDSIVMKVRYFGYGDVENIIQAMAEKMNLIAQ